MARSGVLLLLGLTSVACFAAGWLMGVSTRPTEPIEVVREAAVPAGSAPEPVQAVPARAQPKVSEPYTVVERRTPSAALLEGDGTVGGVVVDQDGVPVAGVTVRLEASWPDGADDPVEGAPAPPVQPIEDEIREYVEAARFVAKTRRETITGDDGRYAFSSLPEGEYWVAGWKEGFEIDRESWDDITPGKACDFVAHAVVWVEVHVTLADGSVPTEAELVFRGPEWEHETWTPDETRVALYPGNWKLHVTHGPDELYESGPIALELTAGEKVERVAVRLEAGQGIGGTVTVEKTGERNPVVYVVARFLEEGEEADASKLLLCDEAAWIGEDGRYAFKEVEHGRYHVGVVGARGEVLASATVDVSEGLRTQDFTVSASGEQDRFRLRVIGPDGKPLAAGNVRITVECETDDFTISRRNWVTLSDPVELVHLLPAHCDIAEAPDGMDGDWSGTDGPLTTMPSRMRHRVFIWAENQGAGEAEYDPYSDVVVEVRLESLATVSVTLEGSSAGAPAEQFVVLLEPWDAEPDMDAYLGESDRAQTTGGAVRKLGTTRPGKRKLVLYALTDDTDGRAVAWKDVVLSGGHNGLSLAIPRLTDLTVRADSAEVLAKLRTQVSVDDGAHWTSLDATSETDTTEFFAHLGPGLYRLVAWGGDQTGVMEFRLPGKSEVHFRPRPFDALVVRIEDDDASLEKAGLVDGDLVISIDGEDLQGTYQIKLLLAQAQANGSARFGVLRNGSTIEFEVDARRMYEGGSLSRTRRR